MLFSEVHFPPSTPPLQNVTASQALPNCPQNHGLGCIAQSEVYINAYISANISAVAQGTKPETELVPLTIPLIWKYLTLTTWYFNGQQNLGQV